MKAKAWLCREIGEPGSGYIGRPFWVHHRQPTQPDGMTVDEAVQMAAHELDDREGRLDDYNALHDSDGERLIEIEAEPGVWRRFGVFCRVTVKYEVTELEGV